MTSKFNSQKSQEDDNVNGSSKRLSAVSTASNNSSTTLDLDFDSVVSALTVNIHQVISPRQAIQAQNLGAVLSQRYNWRLRETGPSSRLAAGGRQTALYFPLQQNRPRILGLRLSSIEYIQFYLRTSA